MAEHRKLAAILAADVVGFSRLTGADEDRTLARLRALRSDLIDPTISVHNGRVIKRTGDGALVEFRSVVDGVRCAIEVQNAMIERNAGLPAERRIEFRIGIHLGGVVEESDGDLMGDGVNIAARLEGLAAPGAICLSEDAYRQVKARLDLLVSDLGATQLKNIADPLRVYLLQVGKPVEAKPATRVEINADNKVSAFPAPSDKPSIAVLPFQNMSGDPEQEFFADGLVEDIITTLSKLAGVTVIARNSSFAYKGRAVDLRDVGRQLGVRYLLEGSVRRAGDRIRVTAQLIDAHTGSHVWAERYDRPLNDIFAVQDEITLVLATEMQVNLTEGEQARLRYTSTGNVEAWSLWVQGLSFARQSVTKENWARALALWQKALALDPDSPPLNAMVGLIHVGDARFGWFDDRPTALAKGRRHAEKALSVDPKNADAHITVGYADMIDGQWDHAIAHIREAVEAAPLSADAATLASFILACAGQPRESTRSSRGRSNSVRTIPPTISGTLATPIASPADSRRPSPHSRSTTPVRQASGSRTS
jgi:adenylate cyclase